MMTPAFGPTASWHVYLGDSQHGPVPIAQPLLLRNLLLLGMRPEYIVVARQWRARPDVCVCEPSVLAPLKIADEQLLVRPCTVTASESPQTRVSGRPAAPLVSRTANGTYVGGWKNLTLSRYAM